VLSGGTVQPEHGHRSGPYWVVIPDIGKPELIVFELRDGHYAEAARVSGGEPFGARRPFAVEVVPARLVAGLQPPA
jgi:hypothetical protein